MMPTENEKAEIATRWLAGLSIFSDSLRSIVEMMKLAFLMTE